MADRVAPRGTARSVVWGAVCKDCLREDADGFADPERKHGKEYDGPGFSYPDEWAEFVARRGGTRSDRCPRCRARHARDARSFAAPYVDIDTIASVTDPNSPTGPLGALGPLPVDHESSEHEVRLGEFDFGLEDKDISRLLSALETRQVAVVVAGTGTGKSTFLPYRLLVPPDGSSLRLADQGPIVITEPRRSAAIDTARFVATRLAGAAHVGAGSAVGYRVKDEPAYDAGCRLLYVTDGSLINWLRDGSFTRFGAIMIDEAHERSKNIDIILGILRDVLPRHPQLRLIIASATIDPAFFVEYFGGRERVYLMDAPDAKKTWGYGHPLWPLVDLDYSHDDWAERDDRVWPELAGTTLRDYTERLASLRINEPIRSMSVLGDKLTLDRTWREEIPSLLARQVLAILNGTIWGDILAFLPGEKTIDEAVALIREGAPDDVDVYPLLSTTDPDIQLRARGEKTQGRRRVVVSTNIAETSLTIDGITYVVDSGLITQSVWNVSLARKDLPATIHSRYGVRQRWGRVGRKAPGWVFPLYTKEQFEAMPASTPPEATRDDLEQFLLAAAAAGIADPVGFEWPAAFILRGAEWEETDAPRELTDAELSPGEPTDTGSFVLELERARRALSIRGALDADGDITAAGYEVAAFGGSASHASAIAMADHLACAIETATALSLLAGGRLVGKRGLLRFDREWNAASRTMASRAHAALRAGCDDDLDLVLKVFSGWERETPSRRPDWCQSHFVGESTLTTAAELRDEMLKPLTPGRKSEYLRPVLPELAPRVRAVLSFALKDRTYAKMDGHWKPSLAATDGGDEWSVDAEGITRDATGVVSMHRYAKSTPAGTRKHVHLSNLVLATDWAGAEPKTWLDVASVLALTSAREVGAPMGPTYEDHWRIADEWEVGARYVCALDRSSGEAQIRAVRLISPAPRAPETSDDKARLGTEHDGDQAARGGLDDRAARPGDTVEADASDPVASADDIAVTSPPGVQDPTQEPRYVDLAEIESDDGETPSNSGGAEGANAPAAAAPLPSGCPRVDFPAGDPPDGPEVGILVLGYEGRCPARRITAAFFSASEVDEPEVTRATSRVRVRVLEVLEKHTEPIVHCIDEENGREVLLEPEDLSFVLDRDLAATIIPGATIMVDAEGAIQSTPLLSATWLDVRSDLTAGAARSPEWRPPMYPARVVDVDAIGRVRHVSLEPSVPSQDLQPIFAVSGRVRLEAMPGTRVGMSLTPPGGEDGWPNVRIDSDGAAAIAAALGALANEHPDQIAWDPSTCRLGFGPGMSPRLRDRVCSLRPDEPWRADVHSTWLWANAYAVEEVRLEPGDEESTVADLNSRYPVGGRFYASVAKVIDSIGVIVSLPDGRTALAHKSRIGTDGVIGPSRYLQLGQNVPVTILSVDRDESGNPQVLVSIEGMPVPDRAAQLRELFPRNWRFVAEVGQIVDSLGAFVRLPYGESALAHVSKIGPDGVLMPSLFLRVGDQVEVEVVGQTTDSHGMSRLQIGIPAGAPPMAEQVDRFRRALPVGSLHVGSVSGFADYGIFVSVAGMTGLAHRTHIGRGIADPLSAGLHKDDPVVVRILEVGIGPDRRPRISLAIPNPGARNLPT